ncbi:MAG: adenylate/guanylate cyclase domain-containing protein [Chthoniobacterales bacterium]
MKRSSVAALVIGVLVSVLVIVLHAWRVTLPLEEAVTAAFAGHELPSRIVDAKLQFAIVVVLALGVAWLVLASARRRRLGWPLVILAVELLALAWICLLFQTLFQPLPALLAIGLSYAFAYGYSAFAGRSRSDLARSVFGGRLAEEHISSMIAGDHPFESEAKSYEVTVLVCDIANKHDLAEECPPAQLGEITQKFIRHATESLLKAGAFLETVTGEGIVAVFGFPRGDGEQADKATQHALSLVNSFEKMRADGKDKLFGCFNVHVGVSSGTMIVAPLREGDRMQLLATGEPVELARRFCIANRFYGSSVLIGPRTFELSNDAIVARPIDFLSGVDSRERHEIYEPLVLASEATPEQMARRDLFWNGVVLYREKRWAEAYSQFQKARGPNDQPGGPLQLYVRRLEPLALQLAMAEDD